MNHHHHAGSPISLAAVIRIHRRQANRQSVSLTGLIQAAHRASTFATYVIVVYDGADQGLSEAIQVSKDLSGFVLLPVQPWGFTTPLNAPIVKAHTLGVSHIIFLSVELSIDARQVKKMLSLFNDRTLIVGKALEGHHFDGEGIRPLTGLNCPWNTCAIWDMAKLAKTGFLLLADTNTPPGKSSIEEAPLIALHQKLWPESSEAILVRLSPLDQRSWNTTWDDPERIKWHNSKMASKNTSAESHLAVMGLPAPVGPGGSHMANGRIVQHTHGSHHPLQSTVRFVDLNGAL